jgi:hypothetical protein
MYVHTYIYIYFFCLMYIRTDPELYYIKVRTKKEFVCYPVYTGFTILKEPVLIHTGIPCTHQYDLRGENCVRTTNAVRYRVTLFFLDCMYRQCKQSTCPFFQQVDLLNHDENLHQTHTLNPRLIFYY